MTDMYIGTDIVKCDRMSACLKKDIPSKVFTPEESGYIASKKNKNQTAAGIFAAKEAVFKCLGTGIRMPLTDVCITHDSMGAPVCLLSGKAQSIALSLGIESISVSISHDGEYALAVASAEKNPTLCRAYGILSAFENAGSDVITPCFAKELLPDRRKNTHKGDYGRLFVLAGSTGLTGAAIMACKSALRSGAGLITLGCAKELNPIFETSLTEVMTMPLSGKDGMLDTGDADKIMEKINSSDVCLIGPGLGRSRDITELVQTIVTKSKKTCIIDADGINALAKNINILEEASCPVILTPHLGEFSALTGISIDKISKEPLSVALPFAKKHKITLVLKSHETVVCTKDGFYKKNILGNPGMATGGSGDVLAGIIASFAAQGRSPEDSAYLGVYLHSFAGDIAALETGEYSLTPEDIIKTLPNAIEYTRRWHKIANIHRN